MHIFFRVMISGQIMMDFLNMYLIQIYLKVLNKISLCKLKELTILAKRMEWYPIA